ncbi:MAG: hypothetical protein IT458_12255 [Planctomycetes bacterium]|nr:hypothetical protein [Planctomycetota bacterium]
MGTPTRLGIAVLFGASLLCAQNGVVSPVKLASRPGSYWSDWPFRDVSRCQQVHGDLRGTARTLTGIAFRRRGDTTPEPQAVARTLDAEVAIGTGDFAAVQSAYAGNYTGPRVVVFARRAWSLPSWVNGQGVPAPFTTGVLFDAPFAYSGQADLVWEVTVFGTTNKGYYPADWHSDVNGLQGTARFDGAGCVATNQSRPILLDAGSATRIDPDRVHVVWKAYNLPLPTTSFAAFLLGATDPDLAVPGLCTKLRSDAALLTLPAIPVAGDIAYTTTLPAQPGMLGVTIHCQAVAHDPAQAPYPWVLSPGAAITTPSGFPDPVRVKQVLSYYSATDPGGWVNPFAGLVVLFRT